MNQAGNKEFMKSVCPLWLKLGKKKLFLNETTTAKEDRKNKPLFLKKVFILYSTKYHKSNWSGLMFSLSVAFGFSIPHTDKNRPNHYENIMLGFLDFLFLKI